MLKHSKKSLLLAAAMLVPGITLAQEKTEAPAKVSDPVVETVSEEAVIEIIEIGEEVEVDVVDGKKQKKAKKVVVDGESSESAKIEVEVEADHEIRMIEIDGDNVPKNLSLILKNLGTLQGNAKTKDGKPKVMTFTIDANGALKGQASAIDKQVKDALKSIDVTIDGVDGVDGQVFRILQNLKPGDPQVKVLNGKSIQLKNLTEAMSDMNMKGTISISSSSSSSSSNGEKPKVVTNSQIRIIGPDGKVQEMSLDADGLNQQSISKAVEEALKKSGKDLPDDVRKRVEAAIQRAGKRSTMSFGPTTVIGVDPADTKKAANALGLVEEQRIKERVRKMKERVEQQVSQASKSSVEQKLDLILNRLEKMQQEIDDLKKK